MTMSYNEHEGGQHLERVQDERDKTRQDRTPLPLAHGPDMEIHVTRYVSKIWTRKVQG